ncbi:MAG: hypothetical protein CMI52_04775 [Parcubacteria group bacterium]|nr:hypothetical protein [Parcubacteria group bacterium]|tara:strand:+ start:244 stop:555 length:312 start_codon:yes stop_codon:yes gene_type:complete
MKKILFVASIVLLGAGCSAPDPNPKVDGYAPSIDEDFILGEPEALGGDDKKDIAPGKASTLETDDGSGIQSSKVIEGLPDDPESPAVEVEEEVLVEPPAPVME